MSFIRHIANPETDPVNQTYIHETANLVQQIGIIGVEGTKTVATPFCRAVIEELKQLDPSGEYIPCYANVPNHGYLYSIINLKKYKLEDKQKLLEEIDAHIPV